jgi:hypothetical protein
MGVPFSYIPIHCPLLTDYEEDELCRVYINDKNWQCIGELLDISAARCARVSYSNHLSEKINQNADLHLAHKLLTDGHMSPFEHQAVAIKQYEPGATGVTAIETSGGLLSGNFKNWLQYRQFVFSVNSVVDEQL